MDYKPQFVEFLAEMTATHKRIADERGDQNSTRNYQRYKKALKGLQDSDEKFPTSKSLFSVKGIGEKTVGAMEAKIVDYWKKEGIAIPAPEIIKAAPKPTKKRKNAAADDHQSSPPVVKKKKAKSYKPAFRSGGYGLLLGLLDAAISAGNDLMYLTKADLISRSIGHCDASYTIGTTAYGHTAWNSIKLLVEKDLVTTYGRPERYSLTETGFALAKQMKKSEQGFKILSSNSGFKGKGVLEDSDSEIEITGPPLPPVFAKPRPFGVKERGLATGNASGIAASGRLSASGITFNKPISSSSEAPVNAIFGYEYVDDEGKSSQDKDNAYIDWRVDGVFYKISYHKSQADHMKAGRVSNEAGKMGRKTAGKDERITGFFGDEDAEELAPGVAVVATPRKEATVSEGIKESPRYVAASVKSDYTPIVWPAGTYEIVLLMDNREKLNNSDRQAFFKESFHRKGISFMVEQLQVGDFLWVARKKGGGDPTLIVLDFIMERKASYDLVSSITGSRFKEQKFRIKEAGLRKMIYLVEENEMNDAAAGIGQESIRTSFSTTQLFDQFTLRRSKNAEESMDYIADLTRFIERKHTKIDLHAIPTNAVSDTYGKMRAEWEAKNPGRKIMTTFEAFNCDFNSKNDNFTRRDVFTRQLMTVRGMGQEKAAAVAEMYPTLMHLKRAYVKCGDGEKMLHRVSEDWGVRRAVGVGLSKKVWALFCEKDMYN